MRAIYKRELKSFIASPLGYAFMAFLILIVSIYFTKYSLMDGYPWFGGILAATTFVFLIIVPLLTMRVLAEERRQKTDQLLLTAPVTVSDIVLGKFFNRSCHSDALVLPVSAADDELRQDGCVRADGLSVDFRIFPARGSESGHWSVYLGADRKPGALRSADVCCFINLLLFAESGWIYSRDGERVADRLYRFDCFGGSCVVYYD